MATADAQYLLNITATAIGRAEFERRGAPETVRPRHFEDARMVLEDLSSALYVQGGGARAHVLNEASRLLGAAAEAPGPDRPQTVSDDYDKGDDRG